MGKCAYCVKGINLDWVTGGTPKVITMYEK